MNYSFHIHLSVICFRVEQAKNLCTNRRTCRFGYTFGRERGRDLDTSESRSQETAVGGKRTKNGSEISKQRSPRLRIDPRRRKNKFSESTQAGLSSEDPVTIRIGGVPIVIPDFDLNPVTAKPQAKTKQHESTLKRPESVNKRRRNRFKTKRKKTNSKTTSRPITFKASTFNPGESSRARQVSKASTTSRPTSRPASRPASNTASTALTSFDSLLQTVKMQNPPAPAKKSSLLTTVGLARRTTTIPITSTTTTSSTTRRKQKSQHKARKIQKQEDSSPTLRTLTTLTTPTVRYQNKECPESLEKCVDTCVPLEVVCCCGETALKHCPQDIYAYSACVVECGERCPVVLV